MLVLGLDFETTGLDVTKEWITEFGAVLWHCETQVPMRIVSEFVDDSGRKDLLSSEMQKITGITDDMIHTFGVPFEDMHEVIENLMWRADAVVAHNGGLFDKPLLESVYQRHGEVLQQKIWIDTSIDIEYSDRITTRKLTHLAAEHNFLNPFAHRAVFDVLTMLRVFSCYDPHEVLIMAQQPTIVVQALVDYDRRELAKTRGYRWNGERKQWLKSLKESRLEREKTEAGFNLRVVTP